MIIHPENFVKATYRQLLRREPSEQEVLYWTKQVHETSIDTVLFTFIHCEEYNRLLQITAEFSDGHYYSPIVDPRQVIKYVSQYAADRPQDIAEVDLSLEAMLDFWNRNLAVIQSQQLFNEISEKNRFYYPNDMFSVGDAILLGTMIQSNRPKKIIEVGSGYSSACMLDSIQNNGLNDCKLICIEPDPIRLNAILKPSDYETVTAIERPVQEIDLTVFADLEANDILFIDSSHVLKTGSDVHYELFHILPVLKPGVFVHFHDIPYPFEYTNDWIFELNRSWNEVYALRAFLMYNSHFEVLFWNSFFAKYHPDHIEATCPLFLTHPGGSIWLKTKGFG